MRGVRLGRGRSGWRDGDAILIPTLASAGVGEICGYAWWLRFAGLCFCRKAYGATSWSAILTASGSSRRLVTCLINVAKNRPPAKLYCCQGWSSRRRQILANILPQATAECTPARLLRSRLPPTYLLPHFPPLTPPVCVLSNSRTSNPDDLTQ